MIILNILIAYGIFNIYYSEKEIVVSDNKKYEDELKESESFQSRVDRVCELIRDGIKKCMKDNKYEHIEEIFGSTHIKRGKISSRRLFNSIEQYVNLRDADKELVYYLY